MQRAAVLFVLFITRVPRLVPVAREFAVTFSGRLAERGLRSAWFYLCYYGTNLWVSFCNCHSGANRVECPCCGWRGYDFIPVDGVVFWRPRMVCPRCLSYDRHRAFSLYLQRRDDRLTRGGGVTLHVAPETYVALPVRLNSNQRYLTTDLEAEKLRDGGGSAFRADLCRLPLADATVDTVICFHVLEHIADDRAAVGEMRRVLKSGGVAYLMAPINTTLEKTKRFAAPDPDLFYHWWAPGRDYITHLDAFETCLPVAPSAYLSAAEAFRYAVPPQEIIFVCSKP